MARGGWRILGLAVVLGAPAGSGAEATPDLARAESEHYVLLSDGAQAEAEEWSRMLEAAWPQFQAFFRAEPPRKGAERLTVSVHATREAWAAAIHKGGGAAPTTAGVGGYYDPLSRTAYLYRQPTTWFTRALLLHESAHQFHYLAKTANRSPPAPWYVEGVAEHLSHHTWDGTTLRLGVVPLLSLEDYPAQADAALRRPGFALEPIVSGDAAPRPESMHLVRFLLQGDGGKHAERFVKLAEKLDRGAASKAAFARTFGPEKPLLQAYRAWLPSVQQPWVPVHQEWDARGPASVRATSTVVSVCHVRGPAKRVEAKWVAPAGAWRAGALLGYYAADDWTVGLVDGAGVRVQRFRAGAWETLPATAPPRPADGRPWHLVAERAGGRVTLRVNGTEVGAWTLPSETLGLAVDACRIDFTDLAWVGG
jgi:hypothetical protein